MLVLGERHIKGQIEGILDDVKENWEKHNDLGYIAMDDYWAPFRAGQTEVIQIKTQTLNWSLLPRGTSG